MELEVRTVGVAGGLGMLPSARLGAGGNVLGCLGRAHTPPGLGWAAGCARPTAGLRAGSPGRRRRKSSRDVRFPGKWEGEAGQRGRNDC